MTDKNGRPITDGAKIKVLIKTANRGFVSGNGIVDFMEHGGTDGPMVALTFDNGIEAYCPPSCVEIF